MIHAALQNTLPFLVLLREVMLAKRTQDTNRQRPIMMAFYWILKQSAKAQQSGGGNGGGRCIEDAPGLGRRIKVPGRNAIAVAMRDVVIGARFGGFKKPRVPAVLIGKAETIQGPAGTARPARIAPVTLLRGLAQEFAALQIENSFLRRGTVAAHQEPARGQAVAQSDVAQPAIARFSRGVKDDPDVHHDVDEERILADKRAQVLPVLLETQRFGFARLNERVFQLGILREAIPPVIGGHEDEPQIVNVAIVLARRERRGVAHRLLQPEFVHGSPRAVSPSGGLVPPVEDPHHSGEKSIAPVGPYLTFVLPLAVGRVHRIEARMSLDDLAHLLLRELHRVFKKCAVRFQDKLDHAFWILAAPATLTCWRVTTPCLQT